MTQFGTTEHVNIGMDQKTYFKTYISNKYNF